MALLRLPQLAWTVMVFTALWVADRRGSPKRLSLTLARLGTTFIKVGQALSLRQDVLPEPYVASLRSLQDHIAPFSVDEAIREIEAALGHPLDATFAAFERLPLASASVAQVHTATLRDGRAVIVKVRRPGIERQIEQDMKALQQLAGIVQLLVPSFARLQPQMILAEIWTNLRKETDFRNEARNIKRFATSFADWPSIYVPKFIEGLVSEAVIVQARSCGLRIDDPAVAKDGPRLAQHFVDLYLHQFFVLGVFHADPHPGNLFITSDGRICFHDFGLVGFLDRSMRGKLAVFTTAFIRQDADWLLDAAIDLGVLGGQMNRAEIRHGLTDILSDFAGRPIKDWSLAEAFVRVMGLGQGRNFLVPYALVILMRALYLIEYTVRTLDPDFQLLETLLTKGPAALQAAMGETGEGSGLERLKLDLAGAAHSLPAVLGTWIRKLERDDQGLAIGLRHEGLEGLENRLDRSVNRLTVALITLGLYIAASLLMQHSIGPRIFGNLPLLAAVTYALAAWSTFRLIRSVWRTGGM